MESLNTQDIYLSVLQCQRGASQGFAHGGLSGNVSSGLELRQTGG